MKTIKREKQYKNFTPFFKKNKDTYILKACKYLKLIQNFNNINENGHVPFKLISDHPIIVSLIYDASVLWILINY